MAGRGPPDNTLAWCMEGLMETPLVSDTTIFEIFSVLFPGVGETAPPIVRCRLMLRCLCNAATVDSNTLDALRGLSTIVSQSAAELSRTVNLAQLTPPTELLLQVRQASARLVEIVGAGCFRRGWGGCRLAAPGHLPATATCPDAPPSSPPTQVKTEIVVQSWRQNAMATPQDILATIQHTFGPPPLDNSEISRCVLLVHSWHCAPFGAHLPQLHPSFALMVCSPVLLQARPAHPGLL